MNFKRILVPVDFSDHSHAALRMALTVARDSAAHITMMHVGVLPYYANTELGWSTGTTEMFGDLQDRLAKEQIKALEVLAENELPEAVDRDFVLVQGYPPAEIAKQVEEGGHDLVVMGTHGRTGLSRALLGSVTERVVAQSPVPVLVVK